MQDFSQSQLMDQGSIHNSGIDIPKRKDKEDLTESSEVVPFSFTVLWNPDSFASMPLSLLHSVGTASDPSLTTTFKKMLQWHNYFKISGCVCVCEMPWNYIFLKKCFTLMKCSMSDVTVGFAWLQDSMGGSPNDIRISDMRPTLVEPPIYKPKVVLLGKDKKGRKHLIMHTLHIHSKKSFLECFVISL